jgi:hypothetical protein
MQVFVSCVSKTRTLTYNGLNGKTKTIKKKQKQKKKTKKQRMTKQHHPKKSELRKPLTDIMG